MKLRYLHTMVRVLDLEKSMAFYALLGLQEIRRYESEQGRFTLVYLAAEGQPETPLELTYNWDGEVEDIYAVCAHLQAHGVLINRPPRDGRMAFVRSPDNISIELLQAGGALAPAEPWLSMGNTGHW